MTMKLEIAPDVLAGLVAQARKSGLSLEDYIRDVLRQKSGAVG